jgi:hypothetical protein
MKYRCRTEKRGSNISNISFLQPQVLFKWKIVICLVPYLKTDFTLMNLLKGIAVGTSPNVEITISSIQSTSYRNETAKSSELIKAKGALNCLEDGKQCKSNVNQISFRHWMVMNLNIQFNFKDNNDIDSVYLNVGPRLGWNVFMLVCTEFMGRAS